ncbi:bile acid:sodium symporter family protein [Sphingorhabdus sp. SMR4y]|uniref:bile acid:sodium symporter family protein n=1 Tax=Sphingorhabdus sp. SMR4y TaxID=2584094 RepID=UPI000B5C52C2|nr:bile acid:sodium symporter family protein [Sphingorhabdus sp. SMR4y]
MQTLRLILTDKFIWLLSGAVLLATLIPVQGAAKDIAGILFNAGIFAVFLLHGIRLERHEVKAGLRNIPLQGTIFIWVFGVMLAIGLLFSRAVDQVLPADVALGFLFLGVLPSTVQSATSYCAIAKGNVAASVVASAFINLVGVFLSPLLFAVLARAAGVEITSDTIIKLATILVLPFVLGQAFQKRLRPWVMQHKDITGWIDRGAIALAVYVSFSAAIIAGMWSRVSGEEFVWLAAALSLWLGLAFGGTWLLGGVMAFARDDRKTLLFSGAQKSVAIGAPLAAIIFAPERAGLVILPLIFYHLAQLFLSAPVAVRLAGDED